MTLPSLFDAPEDAPAPVSAPPSRKPTAGPPPDSPGDTWAGFDFWWQHWKQQRKAEL